MEIDMVLKVKNNPFSPNGIVNNTLFGGREEYIVKILKKLNEVKSGKTASFYLYGERGIGKTALAKFISYLSSSNDDKFLNLRFLTSYYSVQQNQSIRSVLEASINDLADKLGENLIQKISKRIGNVFKNGKFTIGLQGAEASYQYMSASDKNDYENTIKDNFTLIARKIINEVKSKAREEYYDGLLIIIDEMDNMEGIERFSSIIRGITTTLNFEELGYISFLFIGYHDGYEKFAESDISIKRHIDGVHLKEMPDKEIVETFEKGFKEARVEWDTNHLISRTYLTGGYPFAIQVIGYHLIEVDQDSYIDEYDWNDCLKPSSDEMQEKEYSSYYSFQKTNKTNSDKLLLILATANYSGINALSLKELEKYARVKNPRQYLKKLMQEGIVLQSKDSKLYSLKRGLFPICVILDHFSSFQSNDMELKQFIELIEEMREKYDNLAKEQDNESL